MQECEAVLAKEPNAPEILAMLGEIESRFSSRDSRSPRAEPKNGLDRDGADA